MRAASLRSVSSRARLSVFDYLVLAGAGVNMLVIGCLLVFWLLGR